MTRSRNICGLVVLALVVDVAFAEIPFKTRADIVNYGATAIGSPYVWGGGNWDPDDRDFGGADCSGFVCKCWSLTRWTPYRVDYHGPYSTGSLIQTPGPYWDEVDRSELLYGDAIVYRYNNNESGHTYLYLSGDGWGEHEVYEARGSDYGIVHRWRTAYSGADITKGIRRDSLVENIDVTEHIIETDNGAPYYTDSGMDGSSEYDSYAPGCIEGDCRYRWVTTPRNETCTYQPELPETGWYRVYVTCNEGSPNVHDVGVMIDHALGSDRFLWDQAEPASLNLWVPVGDESFRFNAGTEGTVVWDDFDAWPTTGDHVFRGDATKFALDNRVEVDGIGGEPGKFASLQEAIAWIGNHESEEPDVVNVTCDVLVETGCIELNVWDDLTINGDADGNGVPVVVVVTPSLPSDWPQACAMYLDIPIQHHYTLRDMMLIPEYVSAGYATGAYGLVIDEQNPSGEACAMGLSLENVTVAGSLAGNIPTDPQVDSRALATMFGGTDADHGASVLQRTSDWAGDNACQQTVTATDLIITHSTTRGLALRSAYTHWDIDGGLVVTYNGLEGIKADHLTGSTLMIHDSAGSNSNQISDNLGSGVVNVGDDGVGQVDVCNCVISENHASLGGGITSDGATTVVKDCLIVNNSTTGGGGAALAVDGVVILTNCTMADNSADSGGGGVHLWSGELTVSNSILWGNSPDEIVGSVAATYCDVQGGYAGAGNIDRDPVFTDPASGDYHLRRGSPCVNEGDPAFVPPEGETDIDGEQRVQSGFVDMGADETPFWDGDADQDGDVDQDDFVVLVECLAGPDAIPSPPPPMTVEECLEVFDFDEDGDIDLRDFADFRLREPVITVPDIILESRNESGSVLPPPAYVEDGDWNNSTAKSTAPGLTGVGSRYITYELPNTGTDNATFVPNILTPGVYEVFATWGTGANCYDARYTIQHDAGQTTLLVDQIPEGAPGANANTWVSLGQYGFEAGQSVATASVNVSEETVSGKPHSEWNQRVYADAVKWTYVAP
jgi:hypothetical protein